MLNVYLRPLDTLATFHTSDQAGQTVTTTRYAVRQALDQEYRKIVVRKNAEARQARYRIGGNDELESEVSINTAGGESTDPTQRQPKPVAPKRDFFGRSISRDDPLSDTPQGMNEVKGQQKGLSGEGVESRNAWITFHEGFSNAVRKPITLAELMRDIETSNDM